MLSIKEMMGGVLAALSISTLERRLDAENIRKHIGLLTRNADESDLTNMLDKIAGEGCEDTASLPRE